MGVPPRPRRTRRTGSAEDQGDFAVWRIYFGVIVTKPLPLGDINGVARGRAEVGGGAQNPRHLRSPSFGDLATVAALATFTLAVALALALALVAIVAVVGVVVVAIAGLGIGSLALGLVATLVGVAPASWRRLSAFGGGRHARGRGKEMSTFQTLHEGRGRASVLNGRGHVHVPPVNHGRGCLWPTVSGDTDHVVPRVHLRQGERVRETVRDPC